MSSAFLDLTGLSRFLDHLKLLLVQSDWQKTDSTDMAFIKNVDRNYHNREIIKMIIDITKTLGV